MVTVYDGRTNAVNVAGNVRVIIAPAIADMTAPTTAELDAGEAIEKAIKGIAVNPTVSTQTEQYLDETDEEQVTGSTKWSMDPIELVAGDPQTPDTWLAGLTVGQVVYVVQRRGMAWSAAVAAAQKVSVTKCEITVIEDAPVTANANGDKFLIRIHTAVKAHERNVTVAA